MSAEPDQNGGRDPETRSRAALEHTHEDVTAYIFEDLRGELENPDCLVVPPESNVRGGINATFSSPAPRSKMHNQPWHLV